MRHCNTRIAKRARLTIRSTKGKRRIMIALNIRSQKACPPTRPDRQLWAFYALGVEDSPLLPASDCGCCACDSGATDQAGGWTVYARRGGICRSIAPSIVIADLGLSRRTALILICRKLGRAAQPALSLALLGHFGRLPFSGSGIALGPLGRTADKTLHFGCRSFQPSRVWSAAAPTSPPPGLRCA